MDPVEIAPAYRDIISISRCALVLVCVSSLYCETRRSTTTKEGSREQSRRKGGRTGVVALERRELTGEGKGGGTTVSRAREHGVCTYTRLMIAHDVRERREREIAMYASAYACESTGTH